MANDETMLRAIAKEWASYAISHSWDSDVNVHMPFFQEEYAKLKGDANG